MNSWHKGFTDDRLAEAATCYGIRGNEIAKVGGFENLIYGMNQQGDNTILRITHTSHRTEEQVQAELNFVLYLAECEVNVCKPLPSPSGRLIERIAGESGTFLATAFERAPGGHIYGGQTEWNDSLFAEWGRITGRMHQCALNYISREGGPNRMTQDEPPYEPAPDLPEEERMLSQSFKLYEERILRLPRSRYRYGMCHRDLHHGNFYVDQGRIHAFDFDDCGDDYFVQDMAMAVYYAATFPQWSTPASGREQTTEAAKRFFAHFMEGYAKERSVSSQELEQLSLFVEKRRIDLCMILLNEWRKGTEAQQHWLRWNIEGIANGEPCMDLELG
ncbi:phosphotransferase enzyme family protein [Paenibacillus sp. strain BS8-2]